MELYSNDPGTTLNGAINNSVTSLTVASSTGFPTTGNFRIRIDDEIMLVTNVSGTTWTVTRAVESTTAASHSNGATINHILTAGALDTLLKEQQGYGTLASRPSSPKEGMIYFPSDSIYDKFRYNGSSWDAWYRGALVTEPPAISNWAWVNQGTSSADETYGGIHLTGVADVGASIRLLKRTAPATPYTVTGAIVPHIPHASNYTQCGVGFRESGTGKIIVFGYTSANGGFFWNTGKYNSATSFSASYTNPSIDDAIDRSMLWFQLSADGTNLIFRTSSNGKYWRQFDSRAKADFFTTAPDEFFIFTDANSSSKVGHMTLVSWKVE